MLKKGHQVVMQHRHHRALVFMNSGSMPMRVTRVLVDDRVCAHTSLVVLNCD